MRSTPTVAIGLVVLFLASALAPAQPEGLLGRLSLEQSFKAMRQSSHDPSGGNADGRQDRPIQPGETRNMAVIEGAGAITHIWVTIASGDPLHLKHLVLRMYWDGEETPSVETPIGDFFGLGWAQYYQFSSMPIQIGTRNGLNCFWRMPFSNGARVTITNDGPIAVGAFYYYVDYQDVDYQDQPDGPGTPLRFHAQYRQEYPCVAGQNYTILEATGRGHFVGVSQSIHNRADGWWGEGDDMVYIDGETTPSLHGTGSEDYYCGAWCYGEAFSNLYFGCPLRGEHKKNAFWNVYRWHIEDPIPFTESIRFTIEHGHDNDRNDNFSSVAYWYQTEPHAPFPELPGADDRMPRDVAPFAEAGALEMEDFFDTLGGENLSVQDMANFGGWSGNKQLWFTPEGPDSFSMPIEVTEDEAGGYRVDMWYTIAPDYGQAEVWVNGEKAGGWDGYNANGVKRRSTAMEVTLKPGINTIEIRVTGKHPDSAGYMAGIDAFRPTRK